jgi:predicted component of type VI protein secretion system
LGQELNIMIMSGVDDGSLLRCSVEQGDGQHEAGFWVITVGRNDTFVSRHHARLHVKAGQVWLEDRDSTNGSYIEESPHEDTQVINKSPLRVGQLFRVGRTWMRIESVE